MKKIKILCVRFQNELRPDEIEMFRGAVLSKLQQSTSILFHNHLGNGYRYSYPLIQYKCLDKKAAIVCLEEGTEVIGELFSVGDFCFRIGTRMVEMKISSIKPYQMLVQLWDTSFVYRLTRWLPFNEENYRVYQAMEGLADRYIFLEKMLVGNILSFAKGMGIYFKDRITCKILEIEEPYWVIYKGVRMMAFNICFKSNLSLPDNIGLGKGVSLGNGLLRTHFPLKN